MSQSNGPGQSQDSWGSKLGVILAVAGSAVGLGNFLRFPGQAVSNGAGVFMIPYLISLVLLGIPICWAEWTLGRLGGSRGFNSSPGIFYTLWHSPLAKFLGALGMIIPVGVYTYYVYIEAWCLAISVDFMQGLTFEQNAAAAGDYWGNLIGAGENGAVFSGDTPILWFALICFVVNFALIYRGISKGIEVFCKVAMPLLILFAIAMLVRVLTLEPYTDAAGNTRTVSDGLGFMWNPNWNELWNPDVWLAAAGQIFFSLSVGFGIILTYASYLKKDDDVVLSGLTATSMNEFCEVILGGMICVPAAFIFLGQEAASQGTFGLGFSTMPAIFDFLPGGTGQIFGAIWFGLLFLAAVTSSVSMLQPAIAFLEEGFALNRKQSVTLLGGLTIVGAGLIIYFSKGAAALDAVDFWVGTFLIFILATGQVILFGWIYGAERGRQEANRGAEIRIPPVFSFVIKYVTPSFLIVIFVLWCFNNLPTRIDAMSPGVSGATAFVGAYEGEAKKAAALEGDPANDDALGEWREAVTASIREVGDFSDKEGLSKAAAAHDAKLFASLKSGAGWPEGGQSDAVVASQGPAEGAAEGAVTQRTTSLLLILVLIGFVLVTNAAGRLWKKQGHEPGGALSSSR